MRTVLIVLWTLSIFVFTCTANFSGFLATGAIRFQWDAHPQFPELLAPMPGMINVDFIIQKVGHLTAFFILSLLLQSKLRTKLVVFLLAAAYAMLTEFLQLYFTRDGRLFDFGIDSVGILLALAVGSIITANQSKHLSQN